MVLTFSSSEEHILDKITMALADEQTLEHVHVLEEPALIFQGLEIRPRQRQIFLNDEEVKITTREFDVLYYLADRKSVV